MDEYTEYKTSLLSKLQNNIIVSQDHKPKISIILLTHNNEKTIEQCLCNLLLQNFKDFEIIILDNNSEDFTHDIIHILSVDSRIKYFRCKEDNILFDVREAVYKMNSDIALVINPKENIKNLDIEKIINDKDLKKIPNINYYSKGRLTIQKKHKSLFYDKKITTIPIIKKYYAKETLEKPKVSIIVPVYNVEQYLAECLYSLINQTFEEIEIIIINDGSTDKSVNIANVFAKYDPRINIINQTNAGLSGARNTGLKIVRGEYISFVDSDDWLDEDFIEKLYNAAKNSNSDIAATTIVRKRKNSQKYRVHYTEEKIYKTLEEKFKICNIPTCCYVWNKIYKADIIKNFEFKVGAFFEDVLWIPEVLKRANQLITVPGTNYYYRVNNNSIVKKLPSKKKQEDSYNAKKYIVNFFEENDLYLSPKSRNFTKRIYYLLKIPVLKIKEFENIETFLLFGILPIWRKKVEN